MGGGGGNRGKAICFAELRLYMLTSGGPPVVTLAEKRAVARKEVPKSKRPRTEADQLVQDLHDRSKHLKAGIEDPLREIEGICFNVVGGCNLGWNGFCDVVRVISELEKRNNYCGIVVQECHVNGKEEQLHIVNGTCTLMADTKNRGLN